MVVVSPIREGLVCMSCRGRTPVQRREMSVRCPGRPRRLRRGLVVCAAIRSGIRRASTVITCQESTALFAFLACNLLNCLHLQSRMNQSDPEASIRAAYADAKARGLPDCWTCSIDVRRPSAQHVALFACVWYLCGFAFPTVCSLRNILF